VSAASVAYGHPKNKMKMQNKSKEQNTYTYLTGNCGGRRPFKKKNERKAQAKKDIPVHI